MATPLTGSHTQQTDIDMPLVSAIVVTYESSGFIAPCLRSIADHAAMPCEIIVVDNASSDATIAEARAAAPCATILPQTANRGFAGGVNIGARRARGPYLLLLNPDAELLPHTLPLMVEYLDRHPSVAAVGPRLLYADGTPQDSAFTYPSLLMSWLEFFPWPGRLVHSRLNGRISAPGAEPASIVHPLGACMLIRRDAWDEVGPFDESFFLYCEEVDWCVRARALGWHISHLPTATALHHEGQSAAKSRSASLVYLYTSRRQLHRKHRGRIFQAGATLITAFGLAHERHRLLRQLKAQSEDPSDKLGRIAGIDRFLRRQP